MARPQKYTDAELHQKMRREANRLGKSPSKKHFNDDPKLPKSDTYVERFGSWRKAQEEAGIKPNKPGRPRKNS
jgi:hypothetical protein